MVEFQLSTCWKLSEGRTQLFSPELKEIKMLGRLKPERSHFPDSLQDSESGEEVKPEIAANSFSAPELQAWVRCFKRGPERRMPPRPEAPPQRPRH